jgi:ribosomal protein S18 acetylase RimI-like enzyme
MASRFTPDELERLGILGEAMMAAHPHEPHWYLNVVSTLPECQGHGYGAAVLQPVLAVCDAERVSAYLESSNPRNMTLYRRQGFVETGEIELPDGPSLFQMWRDPQV